MERYIPKAKRKIFYIYEHWRPDTDMCFWVGKGKGNRAWHFKRNCYYNNISNKLSKLGMCVEVRLVKSRLTEKESLICEIERIAFWRAAGVRLANLTNGGEGVSGLKHSKKTIALLKRILKGIKHPEQSVRLKGKKHTPEHNAKIGKSLTGRPVSNKTRRKLKKSNTGKKRSDVTKERLKVSHTGKKQSKDTVAKRKKSLKAFWKNNPKARKKRSIAVLKAYQKPEVRNNLIAAKKRYNSNPDFSEQRSAATLKGWKTRRLDNLVGG